MNSIVWWICCLIEKDYLEVFEKIRNYLVENKIRDSWNRVFEQNRSRLLANWICPHLEGKVLDLLCGEGCVGEQLSDLGQSVILYERLDDYDFDHSNHNLPFIPFSEIASSNLDVDTVLLCPVLHHEKDPLQLLNLAKSFKPKKIIVIENPLEEEFPKQFHILVDLFFNQCLNQINIDLPMNHLTADSWLKLGQQIGSVSSLDRKQSIPGIPFSYIMFSINLKN